MGATLIQTTWAEHSSLCFLTADVVRAGTSHSCHLAFPITKGWTSEWKGLCLGLLLLQQFVFSTMVQGISFGEGIQSKATDTGVKYSVEEKAQWEMVSIKHTKKKRLSDGKGNTKLRCQKTSNNAQLKLNFTELLAVMVMSKTVLKAKQARPEHLGHSQDTRPKNPILRSSWDKN